MLQDRLPGGINSLNIQKKLLAETKIPLDKAVELAQTTESAEQSAFELQGPKGEVNRIWRKTGVVLNTDSEGPAVPERWKINHRPQGLMSVVVVEETIPKTDTNIEYRDPDSPAGEARGATFSIGLSVDS